MGSISPEKRAEGRPSLGTRHLDLLALSKRARATHRAVEMQRNGGDMDMPHGHDHGHDRALLQEKTIG